MIIPDISEFDSIQVLLLHLLRSNKARDPKYSYRYFAKKIGWSISLLSDVVHGRQQPSIARVLLLGLNLKMEEKHLDRLIYMALAKSRNSRVSRAAIQRLKTL